MILIAISTKLALSIIIPFVVFIILVGLKLYDQNKMIRVNGNIKKIEPIQGDDDYTNVILWNQNGYSMYRVYTNTLLKTKTGDYVELQKKKFESIYTIGFIQSVE